MAVTHHATAFGQHNKTKSKPNAIVTQKKSKDNMMHARRQQRKVRLLYFLTTKQNKTKPTKPNALGAVTPVAPEQGAFHEFFRALTPWPTGAVPRFHRSVLVAAARGGVVSRLRLVSATGKGEMQNTKCKLQS